ncbi:MAG: hypothetical protein AVDCRST_MAG19-144 [uncultured Thermomicrobiales bacterium]|uniref:Uncharacterized protein n=1 Tax=uncultured Thermomicrobiales bacterium TaxID=1645740 RepID=A0A6J4U8N3_9BACT|nr:MAG: hypothetical protein AVDCRST_MAG19-144 [uncultured Thermomicrobiales bacterium]
MMQVLRRHFNRPAPERRDRRDWVRGVLAKLDGGSRIAAVAALATGFLPTDGPPCPESRPTRRSHGHSSAMHARLPGGMGNPIGQSCPCPSRPRTACWVHGTDGQGR